MSSSEAEAEADRRDFLGKITTGAMAVGLLASYGTFAGYAVRYLYPAGDIRTAWLFVTRTETLDLGGSLDFKTPGGAPVVVARKGPGETAGDFLALSSTCPHLGCQVHWEAQNNQFFCPCHNGTFDANGVGTGGPPKGQELLRYALRVTDGLLYIEVPIESITIAAGLARPGHDACLGSRGTV